MIGPLAADIIGICGSALVLGAFAYANVAASLHKLLFNALNLAGAMLLLISLSVHFNLAALLLEIAWAVVALAGMAQAVRTRMSGPRP